MRDKLKAVLHRRKRSTPTQSPRASYEQPEDSSPLAEQNPNSPRQRDRPRSSSSQSASPRTSHVQKSNAAHKNLKFSQSTTAPLEPVYNSQSNDSHSIRSAADDHRIFTSTLAPSEDSTVESSDTSHSIPSHSADRLNPRLPTSRTVYAIELSEARRLTRI